MSVVQKAKGVAIRESLLYQIWSRQLLRKNAMMTADGRKVTVLFPGRHNRDQGPDFSGALVTIGGGPRLRGDVEIHVRCRDWHAHGHHKDPYYNGVVLHVVMWADGIETSLLQSGERVPVLALCSCLAGSLEQVQHVLALSPATREPCHGAVERYGRAGLDRLLDEAGDERFRSKTEEFKARIKARGPEEALYAGVMRALGYAKNKRPFEKLARLLPLGELGSLSTGDSVLSTQALMLGTAGLLPSQRGGNGGNCLSIALDDPEVEKLQRAWESLGVGGKMNVVEWRFFRVRPENFPPRRIAGASHLVSRYSGDLLAEALRLMGGVPVKQVQKELERSLMVHATGYWAGHYDFGMETKWNPGLIGQGRAREIIVNALLPLVYAWADSTSQPGLRSRALLLYHQHPRLQDNWVTRYMERKVFGDGQPGAGSARQQQGLLHYYALFCAQRRCLRCPLR